MNNPQTTEERDSAARAALGKKTRAALLWMGSTTIMWNVLSWGLTLLTIRVLTPSDYGLFAFAETLLPYLTTASRLDLTHFIAQAKQLTEEDERSLFSLAIVMGAAGAAVGFLLAPFVGEFYSSSDVILPLQLISASFIIKSFGVVPDALLRRELNFKTIGMMNLVTGVGRGLLQLILALCGYGYWSLVVGVLVRDVALTIWVIAARGLPRSLGWERDLIRRAVAYGVPATASSICWVVFSTADYAVVGRLFGQEVLGIYSAAFHLTDLPMSKINQIVRPVIIPVFSHLQHQPENLARQFLNFIRACSVLIFPILVGLSVVAYEAVEVMLGEKWLALIFPLQVMCFVGLVRSFTDNISPLFAGIGRPDRNFVLNLANVVIMPPCFYLLGRAAGINGVYAAWIIVFPIVSFLSLLALRDAIGISPTRYLANVRAPILASIGMCAVVLVLGSRLSPILPPFPRLAIEVLAGGISYLGIIWLFFLRETIEAFGVTRRMSNS